MSHSEKSENLIGTLTKANTIVENGGKQLH